jgi:hypothetical protein
MITIKTNGSKASDMPDIPDALKRDAPKGTKPPVSIPPSERKLLSPSEAMDAQAANPSSLVSKVEHRVPATAEDMLPPKQTLKKLPKEKKPKVREVRAGMTTVAAIASEYGLIPREARGLLRAAKIAKPKVGWAYDAKDPALAVVRELLKAGRGKVASKTVSVKAPKKALPKDAVWSGKAKKTKEKFKRVVPPSPKAEARAEAKKAVKAVGKKNIVKVSK